MEYVVLSDLKDRIVKLSWSKGELILNNNSIYSDSLKIELSCEILDDIARYIKKILITT